MKSIIQDEKECWVCGTTLNLHTHHIFYGPNRKNSERLGLKIYLCARHHNMSNEGVHFDSELDDKIKIMAQKKFEETHTREEFMSIMGRNYIL